MDNKNIEQYGFSEEIVKSLTTLGYENLTEVQGQVIPLILADKDVIVRSQTGSGKTAAFAIPICEKIELEQRSPQVLVLTPTRELAVQLKQDITNIGRFKRIRCAVVFGRQPMDLQRRELKQRVHIIVGTPGRTFDHIERKNINLEEIKYLIIDEADKMLDMGFIEQVESIIKILPKKRVTMLFSATMPEKIENICNQYMMNPIKIEIEPEQSTEEQITQVYYEVEEQEKFNLISQVIYQSKPESCIIFCNTREKVETVFERMRNKGYLCGSLHGGLEQRDRLRTIQSFKRGEFHFLIATDVVARGIHIDDIALVINYDMPLDNESYVHRIGRTGRAGNSGSAMTLVTSDEFEDLCKIEEYIQYKIPKGEISKIEKDEMGKMVLEQNHRITPSVKVDKSEILNQEITRIRINAGKRTKMRPGDILGAISSVNGVNGSDIGVIDVQDTCSYVEILGEKGQLVMDALEHTKIKGKIHSIKKVGFHSMF
ncbi:DEAD/DEAH box helicase [Pelosinus sp. sgz500959]|uniref:DEAD/DEAH box helicase n=1 Tax=Pelosinus sp. sgz500959 TaxID=3242472 RepID=UPI00366C0626